jgi:oligopeptide transport system substrate-binding protein
VFRDAFIALYDDPAPLFEIIRPNSHYNFTGYDNAGFESVYHAALEMIDPAERLKKLAASEAIALEDLPLAPIYQKYAEHMIKPYLTGWQPSPRDSFRSQDLTITR